MPAWFDRAGTELAGGWKGAFDGVQADQEWLHRVFKLQRILIIIVSMFSLEVPGTQSLIISLVDFLGSWHASRKHVCHYCNAVRWLDGDELPANLYTAFGDSAAHRSQCHGSTGELRSQKCEEESTWVSPAVPCFLFLCFGYADLLKLEKSKNHGSTWNLCCWFYDGCKASSN